LVPLTLPRLTIPARQPPATLIARSYRSLTQPCTESVSRDSHSCAISILLTVAPARKTLLPQGPTSLTAVILGTGLNKDTELLHSLGHLVDAKNGWPRDRGEKMSCRRDTIAAAASAVLVAACQNLPKPALAEPRAGFTQIGLASWYGPHFHGKRTANGERFDMNALTAAHRTLPLNAQVRVVDLATGRAIVVRINDRGPYIANRIIDLSAAPARELGIKERGVAGVRIQILHTDDAPTFGAFRGSLAVSAARNEYPPRSSVSMRGKVDPQTLTSSVAEENERVRLR